MSNQEDTFKRNFNAREYLHFYWPEEKLDVEDMFIMTFLHKTCSHYRNFLKGKSWLELSGGPVMDKYISASKYVKEISKVKDKVLILSYNRKTLGQTGSGHFSPCGGY